MDAREDGSADLLRVRLPITGMTCAACERRVGTALSRVDGVEAATVSARTGVATLTVEGEVPWGELAEAVERAGYTVGRAPWLTRDPRVWRTVVVAAAVVGVAAWLLFVVGVGGLGSRLADPGAGGLVLVLVLGLTAGVSTCMALVGGLVLAVSASREQAGVTTAAGRWRPHLAFHAGRVGGFFVLGAALGAIGARLSLPDQVQALFIVVIGAAMALLGLRLTGISPRLAGWSLALPESWSRAVGRDASKPYSDTRAAALGAATFILPCGFTQIVQLYAMTTGSALESGIVMAVFAIGTMPGLLALAGLPMFASGERRGRVLAVVGVALMVFAVVNLSSAAGLLGLTTPKGATVTAAGVSPNVRLETGVQVVTMSQNARGYLPDATVVYAGVPITWVVTSESEYTCASYLRAVGSSWKYELKTGVNTISLPAITAGQSFDFTCVMGMYSGSLVAGASPPRSA
jgi:sulfite exporter TauE/SafE/copper chaperone CopZ